MATKKEGLKANGKLKKGFRYNENGNIVKAKSASTKKKKTTTKRKK